MTQQITTSSIINQKLEHINYFREDGIHDALYISIARDACYTANNSIGFKKKQLSDALADYDRFVSEKDDNAAERVDRFIGRMYQELEILEERLEIEKSVYFIITDGEEWKATPPKSKGPRADIDALRKKLAA
jgi:hypothetical protein